MARKAQVGCDERAPLAIQRHAEFGAQGRGLDPGGPEGGRAADPLVSDLDPHRVDARDQTRGPDLYSERLQVADRTARHALAERGLEDVSFVAKPGETVAVVGPTGAGKTTLVSLIPRIYDTTGGEVLVDGIGVKELDPDELRTFIGVVPQDPFLFSTTIEENIGLGLPGDEWALEERQVHDASEGPLEDPDEAVAEAARIAQLDESIRGFPKGYGTYLGERGINLSGGQKQRATLARAVARDPTILILDDALSAVDTHTEALILDDLARVMAGRTSFIISHRVSAVMNADLILVLDDSQIVERGRHAELMALGGTYATLLRRQMLEQDIESTVVGTAGD